MKIKNLVAPITKNIPPQFVKPLAFISLFAFIGLATLVFSRAASTSFVIESESATLACPTKEGLDSTASGGKFIEFGSPSCNVNPCQGASPWATASNFSANKVPFAGESATIPAGKKVCLDTSPPKLSRLTIEGELAFDDNGRTLKASTIWVKGGKLVIGSEARPLASKTTIILDSGTSSEGTKANNLVITANGMNMDTGQNQLAVSDGGVLDVHGAVKKSWTTLSQSAGANTNSLKLSAAVDWNVGDKIMIASTDFTPTHTEEKTISAISADGKTITLVENLAFGHYSGSTSETSGTETRTLEQRAEVGLLSRNLVIRGANASENSAAYANKYGGHVINLHASTSRIENTEFLNMGQLGVLGKYPMHWHHTGNASASYAKNNSITHSFNRALTIHRTDNLLVEKNVAYDSFGHMFMLEDGVEVGNKILGNLAALTRITEGAQRLIPSDRAASEYWITHPTNEVVGNVAAGSYGAGFWYDFEKGTSPNDGATTTADLGKFDNNISHSHIRRSTDEVNGGGYWMTYTGAANKRYAMNNNAAWKNERVGIWGDGRVDYNNMKLAQNNTSIISNDDPTHFNGGIVFAHTANNTGDILERNVGIGSYHSQFFVDGVWFSNFFKQPGERYVAMASPEHYSFGSPEIKNVKVFGEKTYAGCADPVDDNNGNVMANIDGSLFGTTQGKFIISNDAPLAVLPTDTKNACGGYTAPMDGRMFVRLENNEFIGNTFIKRDDGVADNNALAGLSLLNRTYDVTGPNSANISSQVEFTMRPHILTNAASSTYFLKLVVHWAPSTVKVTGYANTEKEASSLANLGKDGNIYFDKANKKVYIYVLFARGVRGELYRKITP